MVERQLCTTTFRLLAWALVLAWMATPARADRLTVAVAVQRALTEGPSIRIAEHERRAAESSAAAAESVFWPKAYVTSRAGYSDRLNDRLRAVDRSGREREYGLLALGATEGWFNVFVHQTLIDVASWADARRATYEAEVARISEAELRERIAYDVVQAYLLVQEFAHLHARQQDRRQSAVALDERAEVLLRAGRCLSAEREDAALYRREIELDLSSLERQRNDAWNRLSWLIGVEPMAADRPDLAAAHLHERGTAPTDELDRVPEIALWAVRRRIAEARVDAARGSRYPSVGIGAGYSHYGIKRFDSFADEMRAGIDFRMSVFDGFQSHNSIAAAEQLLAAMAAREAAARRNKQLRLSELENQLVSARAEASLASERVRLGEERIRLADLALDTQRGAVSVALAARRDADRSLRGATRSEFESTLVQAEIERERGRLIETLLAGEDRQNP